jgi:hypothetical protein
MNVYETINGTVIQVWRDVDTVDAFKAKYGASAGRSLHEAIDVVSGQVLVDGQLVTPAKTDAVLADEARRTRDRGLTASDWRAVPDYPNADYQEWMTYRQELRDITEQAGFPSSIYWPIEP